jgi:hypothetical protein
MHALPQLPVADRVHADASADRIHRRHAPPPDLDPAATPIIARHIFGLSLTGARRAA